MNEAKIEGEVVEIFEDKRNLKVRVLTASGEGRNGPWAEYAVASFYGRAQQEVQSVVRGQRVRITGRVKSHEYNGRWYSNFDGERLVVMAQHREEQAGDGEGPGPGDDDVNF